MNEWVRILLYCECYLLIEIAIMGCMSPQNAGLPSIPAHHLNRLLQISDVNHPLNINKKYEHLAQIEQSCETGSGYRKTYAYKSLTTKEEIEAKRAEFWETRVNGEPAIWGILKQAIQAPSIQYGMNLLNQNKISLLNRSIQICVDSKLNKYEIPIFCINEPISYSRERRQDQNLNKQFENKTMEIVIRSTKYPNGDIKVSDEASSCISSIKDKIKVVKELNSSTKIRLFYSGREMNDDKSLGNYSYKEGTIIQAMIL